MYKQYLRTVVGTMQERTNTDTHEKIVAIFSIMHFVFRYPLACADIPSLRQHIKRREIYYVDCKVNLCFWKANSFIMLPNSKDKRWKDSSRIVEANSAVQEFEIKRLDHLEVFEIKHSRKIDNCQSIVFKHSIEIR
ncbi:MAG: hypothetical protein EZS28_013208 [Streblomastix strix]|uniref:Uncharacterized protein n=1 Tax=Streblomastix strix TaxID=222440 RepID=A0A5J4W9C5_9EUKA|nr:MAG: hypothetical protein EZS28_013208 [Streblomastix strix]